MTATAERLAAALADRYRIERELGQGGMATVYLAEDLKHDRKVAIKVLKPELAAVLGAERFVQEIKTTAALSHPHILPLFDSDTTDGFLFYVMPYIQGETIREKLNRETQFGIDEAVRIASEVADALDYAHRNGVIHRDIKPENILLHDGRPMVMDFGIALAVSAAAGGRMTETGLSLGTPHYMSPEQATADKDITGRSDVYSLASVLYEMLTGNPPHMGSSAQQIIMKIISEPVQDVTALRKSVPSNVAAALARALEKLPADRFDGASALAQALADPHFAVPGGVGATTDARHRGPLVALAALTVVFAILAVVGWLHEPPVTERPFARFTINAQGMLNGVDVSPEDGAVLFNLAQLAAMRFRPLERDSIIPLSYRTTLPRISPDGRKLVGTMVNGDLVIADFPGGAPQVIAKLGATGRAIWGRDGFVYFSLADGGLGRISEGGGGSIDTLVAADTTQRSYEPLDALPDGKTLLISRWRGNADTLALFDVERRAMTPLFAASRVVAGRYVPPGYIVYNDVNRIIARSFDARRQVLGAETITIAEGPRERILGFGIGGSTLAYATFGGGTGTLVITDRQGNLRPLPNLPPGDYNGPSVSPDGQRIAVIRIDPTGERDLWVYQMPAGPLTQLTRTGDVQDRNWLGDGERIAYARSGKDGDVFWRRSDGSGNEQLLLHRDGLRGTAFFQDGQQLVYHAGNRLMLAGVASAPEDDQVIYEGRLSDVSISPRGRWLAFTRFDGAMQIYIQPIADSGPRLQVSVRSGLDHRWSRDERKLYYLDGADLMEATLEFGADVRVASRVRLPFYDRTGATWDVFPDDNRFVMTRPTDDSGIRPGEITVITNFDVLLDRLARGAR